VWKWKGTLRAPDAVRPGHRICCRDFWFELAFTYYYPAAMRIAPLAQQRGKRYAGGHSCSARSSKAQGWPNSSREGPLHVRDLERLCAALQLPFVRPSVFPQNTILASRIAVFGLREG
jgi:2-hydroxychromene-2-carboxylate isomerase